MHPIENKVNFSTYLPSETVLEITSKLDSLMSLCRLSCVSKNLSQLINNDVCFKPWAEALLDTASKIDITSGLPLKEMLKERIQNFFETFQKASHLLINPYNSAQMQEQEALKIKNFEAPGTSLEQKLAKMKNYISKNAHYIVQNEDNALLAKELLNVALKVGFKPTFNDLFSALVKGNQDTARKFMLFGDKESMKACLKTTKEIYPTLDLEYLEEKLPSDTPSGNAA